MNNPLQKYFRQPKIYISLPSNGNYYPSGARVGDSTNIPVYGMTGIDEIAIKTPDALFSGEATAQLIHSCCPSIVHPKQMPVIDLETVLIAIRIATLGNNMEVSTTCKKCETVNDYEIDLSNMLDHFSNLKFNNEVTAGDVTVYLRPLSYGEVSEFGVKNFSIQKRTSQLSLLGEQEQRTQFDEIYKEIANLQFDLVLSSIESVRIPGAVVAEREYIAEWLKNIDKSVYSLITATIEKNKSAWEIPDSIVECSNPECKEKDAVKISLDYSSFFV